MAHFLVETKQRRGGWAVVPLAGDNEAYFLTGDPANPVMTNGGDECSPSAVYVIRHNECNGDKWKLFAAPEAEIYLNGRRVSFCMQVLKDKDELRIGQSPVLHFSTARLAGV